MSAVAFVGFHPESQRCIIQLADDALTSLNTQCSYCGGAGTTKRCSRCAVCRYCNPTCQLAAWKRDHKSTCGILRQSGLITEPRLRDASPATMVAMLSEFRAHAGLCEAVLAHAAWRLPESDLTPLRAGSVGRNYGNEQRLGTRIHADFQALRAFADAGGAAAAVTAMRANRSSPHVMHHGCSCLDAIAQTHRGPEAVLAAGGVEMACATLHTFFSEMAPVGDAAREDAFQDLAFCAVGVCLSLAEKCEARDEAFSVLLAAEALRGTVMAMRGCNHGKVLKRCLNFVMSCLRYANPIHSRDAEAEAPSRSECRRQCTEATVPATEPPSRSLIDHILAALAAHDTRHSQHQSHILPELTESCLNALTGVLCLDVEACEKELISRQHEVTPLILRALTQYGSHAGVVQAACSLITMCCCAEDDSWRLGLLDAGAEAAVKQGMGDEQSDHPDLELLQTCTSALGALAGIEE
jgi:hypothetical protein